MGQLNYQKEKNNTSSFGHTGSRYKWQQCREKFFLTHYFIVKGSKASRVFFFSLLKMALKNGLSGLFMLQTILLFFVAQREYIGHLVNQLKTGQNAGQSSGQKHLSEARNEKFRLCSLRKNPLTVGVNG